jgi:hypothetical protein
MLPLFTSLQLRWVCKDAATVCYRRSPFPKARRKETRKRRTRSYGPEYPCGDVSFRCKHFKGHTPRNFRNSVCKGESPNMAESDSDVFGLCAPFTTKGGWAFCVVSPTPNPLAYLLLRGRRVRIGFKWSRMGE